LILADQLFEDNNMNLNKLISSDEIEETVIAPTSVSSDEENMELYSNEYPFTLPLRIRNFENEAELTKYVKNCEKLIRGSQEYKLWRQYIIDVLGVNTCMITNESMAEVTVEVHHHIPSLFTMVKSVINKKLSSEVEFSSFDICLDTIELHFLNRVGYAVLLKSIHEKHHNGYMPIPVEIIKGNYSRFLRDYTQYIDEDELNNINDKLTVHEHNCNWGRDNYTTENQNEAVNS
jgi:hypothetical protein